MTVVPAGAQLAPIDLPPPHPAADPREPSPTLVPRRGARTPVKARSPAASRSTSPTRPSKVAPAPEPLSLPSLHAVPGASVPHHAASSPRLPHLQQPSPRPAGAAGSPLSANTGTGHTIDLTSTPHPLVAHHRLSRPSSPSSIHSSTSAIFERDIELPAVASLSMNSNSVGHTLNHKSSRLLSHGSALDHSVPAVLDDAVEALSGGTSRGIDDLEIEAPVLSATGMARQQSAPISQIHHAPRKVSVGPVGGRLSRSPSPASVPSPGSSSITSPLKTPQALGQLATGIASSGSQGPSPTATRPPMMDRMSTGPLLPGGWAFGGREEQPEPVAAALQPEPSPPLAAIPSHLTPTKDKRRISYISYNDLLLSVPTHVTQLNEITSGHLSPEHLPGTISPGLSSRSPILQSGSGAVASPASPEAGMGHKASWDAGMGGLGLGAGQGEWGREGLGRGLEQRLEDLAQVQAGGVAAGASQR